MPDPTVDPSRPGKAEILWKIRINGFNRAGQYLARLLPEFAGHGFIACVSVFPYRNEVSYVK